MQKIIIGIGIPGTGKTTYLKKIASEQNYTYVSSDEVREEVFGDAGNQNNPDVV